MKANTYGWCRHQGVAKYASGVAATAQYPNGSHFQSYIHRNPVPFAQVQSVCMLPQLLPQHCHCIRCSNIEAGSMHEPLAMLVETNLTLI